MLQKSIEKAFFRGKSTESSAHITYVIGNVILILVLVYVLINVIPYRWTGSLYPVGFAFRLDFLFGGLEDAIPFVPQMVIFYLYLFYPMVILTILYFVFVEYRRGYAVEWSLVIITLIADVFFVFFPVSVYWWHQEFLMHPILGNFWAGQVYHLWARDSHDTRSFPSLHAAGSVICFYTWYQYSRVKPAASTKLVAILSFVITVGVILSTILIKQHYIADEVAGILLALGVGRPMFKYLWK
jgi:membrane-associated phospholipid phosphatase